MIEWINFEKHFYENSYYKIDNGSDKNIVVFGNCQISTIGFFLNQLFQKKYNIIIILSWFFDKYNNEYNFDMKKINNEIQNIIYTSDYFIYHKHINDYLINASIIDTYISPKTRILQIPNLRLIYNTLNKNDFIESINRMSESIKNSNFNEFKFILENINSIIFFNTPEHPTHYLLFILAKAIYFKINIPEVIVDISIYYNEENRKHFKYTQDYVYLPGKIKITQELSNITQISTDADYFDL